MRVLMVAVAIAVGCSLAAQPDGVGAVYESLRVAVETEDIDSIIGHLAPVALLQARVGEGWVQDLGQMFAESQDIAAELSLDEVDVQGDKAYVHVTWALSGTTVETGEAWSQTEERADILLRRDDVWLVLGSDIINAEGLATLVLEGMYDDPRTGISVRAPNGWRVIPFGDRSGTVVAYSPDLTAMIVWSVSDLPGPLTADQLASNIDGIITNLAASVGLTAKDGQTVDATLAGRPARRVSYHLVDDAGVETYIDRTFCVVGQTAYTVAQNAIPPAGYTTHKAALNEALASTTIVAPEVVELPPGAGRIEAGRYVNDVHGCSIDIPAGWEARVGTTWNLQVSMHQPGSSSFLTLGMVDLPSPDLTAEGQARMDLNVAAQAMDSHQTIRQGDMMVGELPAYETVAAFDLGGLTRQRHRMYLVDAGRLFFAFADAVPASSYERVGPIIEETIQSLKLSDE